MLAQEIVTSRTKVLIVFVDGLFTNGDEILRGITSYDDSVVVAGGLSGDAERFQDASVVHNNIRYDRGAVLLAIDSDVLEVKTEYSFGFSGIGIKHKITKVDKNRVYTIDNMPVVDFYAKYLGDAIAKKLPPSGIDFPIIIERDSMVFARAVTQKHDDGSVSYAGELQEGDTIQFGIANANTIAFKTPNIANNIGVNYIYSCVARRVFMPELIHNELVPYASQAPTSGFFTYGEFFTNSHPKLLNQTLTALSLCENCDVKTSRYFKRSAVESTREREVFNGLLQFGRQVSEEYAVMQKELHTLLTKEKNKSASQLKNTKLLFDSIQEGALVCNRDYIISDVNTPICESLHYSLEEFQGSSLLDYAKGSEKEKLSSYLSGNETTPLEVIFIDSNNEERFFLLHRTPRSKFYGKNLIVTMVDITDINRERERMLIHSKMAQMGEMVSMIAHQWRQPLNAISAASIQLSMKHELELMSEDEFTHTQEFIQQQCQKMSKVIDTFMNYAKQRNEYETFRLSEIMQTILNLTAAQFSSHGITVAIDIDENYTIKGVKNMLEQVMINLLVNAKDAYDDDLSSQEKVIRIYTEDKKVIIEDNAGGVDSVFEKKLFLPYFTTKEQGKGTGLGLYMSKKIMQEHFKGDLVYKRVAKGSQFVLQFDKRRDNEN